MTFITSADDDDDMILIGNSISMAPPPYIYAGIFKGTQHSSNSVHGYIFAKFGTHFEGLL